MADYIYLYRGGNPSTVPAERQKHMQKWMDWMKALGQKGHLKDPGQPLEPTGKVVRGKDRSVTDGPYAEAKDLVGGFTIVSAKDLAEAVEYTAGCPIFESGGSLEVRPVLSMNM